MFDKIIAHTSFIGETGYANHSRNFFTALNKIIPVKVRNFAAGETWTGLNNGEPHNNEWYLTDEHKEMLYKQTCLSGDKRTDYYIYGGDEEVEKGNNLHIVLNEVNHHYFYDNYDGPKIAYTVWESTLYPDNFFNKIQEFDQLWVPTKWQKDCSINQGYAENKIRVVPEAVDGNIFYPEEVSLLDEYKDGRFKFLLLGRWDYRKCTKEIIESFLRVFKNDDLVDLVVSIDNIFATDGIKTTEERLEYFNFNNDRIKVKHFPSRENYVKYLKTGHVFLSCARGEGWNLPLIESMACGTPSIYSNWGAQLEYANDKGIPVDIIEEKLASLGSGYKMISGDIPGNYSEPDFENLCMVMRDAYENHDDHKQKALKDSEDIRKEFTWENSARKAFEYLSEFEDRNIFQSTRKCRLVDKIIDEVYNKKVYEKYFKVEDGDIVVDIGGHIGTFARSISDRNFEKCFCIEPDKVNIGDMSVNLSRTTKINDYEIVNYAIDDDTGSNFFHRGNMGFNRKVKDALEGEAVDTISFLDFINKYNIPRIDFLKLDCEGGEYAIIGDERNHDFLRYNVDKIVGELHLLSAPNGKKDGLFLMDKLKELGFQITLNSVNGIDITNYFPDHVDYYSEILFYAKKKEVKNRISCFDGANEIVVEKGDNVKVSVNGMTGREYHVEFYNRDIGKQIYKAYISNNSFAYENIADDKYPSQMFISVISSSGRFFDFIYDRDRDSLERVNTEKDSSLFDKVKPPIIISGSPGGGTSYVAKLLRHCGLYAGTDSGPMEVRKYHESKTFTSLLFYFRLLIKGQGNRVLDMMKDSDVSVVVNEVNSDLETYSSIIKDALLHKFNNFWGEEGADSAWGWKCPQNSIFCNVWHDIFPEAKFLIIEKEHKPDKTSKNREGQWFYNESSSVTRYHYFHPEFLNLDADVFHLSFDRVVKDYDYFNSLLEWIGLEKLGSNDEFINLLEETGYEGEIVKDSMELYQDQYVNGEVIGKGIRDCSSRYDVMKQVFDKYERPFTILDIGANFGYYSIRAATEYDATAVMIESEENECFKLISLADRNNCKDRLIVLNKRISLYELKELAKCEHFDVVLALNVIHHFGDEDIKEVCEVFSNLGDNLIIETPPSDDKNACGGKHLKPINDFYSGREKMLLGSFDRHTCDGKSDIYWLETPKDKLSSTYFEYDTLFYNGTIDEKMTPCLIKKDNIVNSTFTFKNLDNKRHNRVLEWIPGINLMTFIKLNGRYPFPENIISKIERRDIETGYGWDNKNNDLVLHNIIVNGSDLHLIDYDDKIVSVSGRSDSEQIDIILRTLRKHYNLPREGIDGNIAVNFLDGPSVEITGRNSDKEYDVLFVNRSNSEILHNGSIKCNHWINASRRWFTDWDIIVNVNGRKVFSHTLDLKGKRVLVGMESKSLGDTIAWIPYVEEFRKKHQCNIFVATFWNSLFEKEYSNLRFISPGQVIPNIYATYKFGWFTPFNVNNNPNDFRTISLQQCASDILGLEYEEIRPLITIPDKPKVIKDKYVCIGIHGTSQCKYWNCPNGWQDVISYLNKKNYKAVMIHKEKGTYMGNIPPGHVINKTGDFPIEERIIDLKYADAFIGIGSGLSWLAWAVGTPVVMISGFSKPWCEFTTGVERLHNPDVCNGCFNDSGLTFDKGNWEWCPRDKDFECTKSITSDMVIERIDKILGDKYE